MKWNNKGHQFDRLGETFKNRKIYIYGAGACGKFFYEYLSKSGMDDMVDGFIDHNYSCMQEGCLGKPVLSPENLFAVHNDAHIIIVALSESVANKVMDRLIRAGYLENVECFLWNKFTSNLNDIYLPVYAMYAQDRIILSSTCTIPSNICNLRCRDCLNFTPYLKQFEVRDIDEVCKDMDILFSWVDFTYRFQISGGEPLLYKNFVELANYIGERYRNRIDVYETVLNGTLVPSDEVCKVMKHNKMTVILDNYTKNIPKHLNHREEIINQLEKYGIIWIDNTVKEWFNLDIFNTDNSSLREHELVEYFDMCNNPWHCYENGRMYVCNFDRFATKAGLNEDVQSAYFDLKKMTDEKKMELLEFTLNYNELGYVQLCKKCSGWADANKKRVPVAIQMKE